MLSDDARYPSLEGRAAFVTGGASGIGESIVEHFCAQRTRVTFVDLLDEAAEALIERIADRGHTRPRFVHLDVKDVDALSAEIERVGIDDRPIQILVNNAGNDDRHAIGDLTADYWDDRMAVNLRHQFFAVQAVRPQMRDSGGGSIINMGSITSLVGDPNCIAYVSAKSAIIGMTRGLARELGGEKIRVNCVLPGWVMTKRQLELWMTPAGEQKIADRQCLSDRVYPPDIARMVLFLGADDSRMCTAQSYVVDAGWA